MEITKRASAKEIFGWCMFDFANSSYTTVIISVIYCNIFAELIVPIGSDPENPFQMGNFLWSVALAISYILTVITGPVFGAITDYSSKKKLFLFLSYVICIISTASLYFVHPGLVVLGMILIIISNFAFSSSENFASSFLPFLGPKEDLGKISGYAWGVGYFGGIASVVLSNAIGGEVKLENISTLLLVGPTTAIFFLIAAIPTFLFLKEHPVDLKHDKSISYLKVGFDRVITTLKEIKHFEDLGIFLISLFFTMAAFGVVISFTFIYGKQEIHIESKHAGALFLLIQISAAFGAIAFGIIQDKIGAMKTFNMTLYIWLICVIMIYFIRDLTNGINYIFGGQVTVQWVFVGIGVVAGLGLGATQSASRAIVGLLAPESKTGEFYGLWGLSGKLASAFGLLAVGFLQTIFTLRNSFLILTVFFFLSLIINRMVDEKRGMEVARTYKD